MRKSVLYLSALVILAWLCTGCNIQMDQRNNPESIVLPVISLESTGETINPAFYEKGFDFKYDDLPTLTLTGSHDVMRISLSDNFSTSIELGEDYYNYTDNTATIEKETYELTKGVDKTVLHPINRRGHVRDEQAIYYLRNHEGTFVFKVILPVDKNN